MHKQHNVLDRTKKTKKYFQTKTQKHIKTRTRTPPPPPSCKTPDLMGVYELCFSTWCCSCSLLSDWSSKPGSFSKILSLSPPPHPRANLLNVNVALNFTLFLRNEREFIPWDSAVRNLEYFFLMFDRSQVYGLMQVSDWCTTDTNPLSLEWRWVLTVYCNPPSCRSTSAHRSATCMISSPMKPTLQSCRRLTPYSKEGSIWAVRASYLPHAA